jgi:protein-disulfide isomerase
VGGAERNARRRRQQQQQGQTTRSRGTVAAARKPDRTKLWIGVVVVALIAGAVIVGVIVSNAQKNKTEGQAIKPASVSVSYPVTRDGVVVVAGKSDAKVTIDVYEDFLCPFCRQFEENNHAAIEQKLGDGSLRVRYHLVTILNERSDPPGYSLDAANAAVCAADSGQFPAYYRSLFNNQPEEGARGFDKAQLATLGSDLGAGSDSFKSCVDSGRYNADIQTANDQVTSLPYLQKDVGNGQKSFGTPTIAVGEKLIDVSDTQWLDKLFS